MRSYLWSSMSLFCWTWWFFLITACAEFQFFSWDVCSVSWAAVLSFFVWCSWEWQLTFHASWLEIFSDWSESSCSLSLVSCYSASAVSLSFLCWLLSQHSHWAVFWLSALFQTSSDSSFCWFSSLTEWLIGHNLWVSCLGIWWLSLLWDTSEFHGLGVILLLLLQLWIIELSCTCLLSWELLFAAFACWSLSWLCWWAQQCEHCLQWHVSSSETLTSSV